MVIFFLNKRIQRFLTSICFVETEQKIFNLNGVQSRFNKLYL